MTGPRSGPRSARTSARCRVGTLISPRAARRLISGDGAGGRWGTDLAIAAGYSPSPTLEEGVTRRHGATRAPPGRELDGLLFAQSGGRLSLAKGGHTEVDLRGVLDELAISRTWMACAQTLEQSLVDLDARRRCHTSSVCGEAFRASRSRRVGLLADPDRAQTEGAGQSPSEARGTRAAG